MSDPNHPKPQRVDSVCPVENRVYAVMYHNKCNYKFSEVHTPLIFYTFQEAHNYVLKWIDEENKQSIKEGEPDRWELEMDFSNPPKEGEECWMKYYVYTNEEAIWISSTYLVSNADDIKDLNI